MILLVLVIASIISLYLGLANITIKFDKFVHFSVFFLMTLIFYYCFETKNANQLRLMTFIVCTLCGGIGSEFLQSIMPYRTFDYKDIVMNISGSSLGILVSDLYSRYIVRRRRLKRLEIIKSIGDEGETLAENYNRSSGTYSDFDTSARSSMSGYYDGTDADDSNTYSDYYADDLENQIEGTGIQTRGRRDTTSIELKNIAPISLNDLGEEMV